MVDENSQFYAILTNVGAAKQANADALGIPWKITQMAVGDANGTDPTPNATQTSLINEWRRAPLNQLKVDDKDAAIIVAEQVIPADIGGKWIREIALYDADGDMVAVANCAPTYKPLLNQGSGRTQVVRMSLVVSSSSNVQLKIDPSVVLATREFVTEELARQDFKHSVLAATTAAITLSGLQTIDGIVLTAGARVLVKNQAVAKDNGLYVVVAGGAWARAQDADSAAKVTPGLLVLVERGTVNADSAWQLVTDSPITLGVTALAFEMAFGRTGIAAGTYRSVQVDAYGRVLAASNPTTVAGYGLTDVYTRPEMDSVLALKAPLASPVFTGTPTAATAPKGTSTAQLATTAFVVSEILALVDTAPGALDTLKELAAALGNDPNFSTTMLNELAKKAPLASPAFTGAPTAPSPAAMDASNNLATTAYVYAAQHGLIGVDVAGAGDFVLSADQAGKGIIYLTGALTGDRTIILPRGIRRYLIRNATSYPFKLTVKMTVGGGVEITQGKISNVFTDSTNTYLDQTDFVSPALLGIPTAPTADIGTSTAQVATTKFIRDTLSSFGVGSSNTGNVSSAAQLSTLPSGNYYYPADFSPYGSYAFAQRLAYTGNRGFEIANIPYTDRFLARSSNMDGSWRAPIELAIKSSTLAGYGILDAIPNTNPLPAGSYDLHGANYAFVTSPNESSVAQNVYWDGAKWVKHDNARAAAVVAIAGGTASVRRWPAGTPGSSPYTSGEILDSTMQATDQELDSGAVGNKWVSASGLAAWFYRKVKSASEAVAGICRFATLAEVVAGTGGFMAVCPAYLIAGFSYVFDTNGFIKLPNWMGGVIIQWAYSDESAGPGDFRYFPVPFTQKVFGSWLQLSVETSTGFAGSFGTILSIPDLTRYQWTAAGTWGGGGKGWILAIGK